MGIVCHVRKAALRCVNPVLAANGAGTLAGPVQRRLHRGGRPMFTIISVVSAFAEYATVSLQVAGQDRPGACRSSGRALFGCAVLTGVGVVINTAKVPAGSSVAVIGLGGVGLSAL